MAIYGCGLSSDYMDWIPVMGIVILITFFGIALVYMASQVWRRPDWSVWAKSELWQAIVSCIMIGLIFSLIGFTCLISESIANGDPFITADRYLHRAIWNGIVPAVDSLFQLSFSAQKKAAFTIGLISCYFGVCFQPYAGLATLSYNFETIAAIITPFGASLMFQKLFLQFIKEIAFTIVLPIGFILKVFPFTRDAGAFLIAAAIGLYAVLPLMYVFNQALMLEVMNDPSAVGWCDPNIAGFGSGGGLGYGLCRSLTTIGVILPQAVFLPALNMVVTISFIQAFSKILSRDYMEDLSGGGQE